MLRSLLTGGRKFQNLRGAYSSGFSEGKMERLHYRAYCQTGLPTLKVADRPVPTAESGGRVLRLSPGCQVPGEGLWLAAARIL